MLNRICLGTCLYKIGMCKRKKINLNPNFQTKGYRTKRNKEAPRGTLQCRTVAEFSLPPLLHLHGPGRRRRRGREGHPQGVAGVERPTWPRRAGRAGSCGGGPFPEHRLRAAVEDADTLSSSFPTAVEDASPLSADYTCTGCRSRRAGTTFGERRPAMSARSRRRSSVAPCSPSSTPPTECLIKCQRGGGVVRPPCARCKVTLPIFVPYQTQIPTQHVSQEKTNQT